MIALSEMYPGLVNSVETIITGAVLSTDTVLNVQDDTRIPDAPNLLVLGGNLASAETVKLLSKSGNAITVQRGFQGTAKAWPANTSVARNFTEADYAALVSNIKLLSSYVPIVSDTQPLEQPEGALWLDTSDGETDIGSGVVVANAIVSPTEPVPRPALWFNTAAT